MPTAQKPKTPPLSVGSPPPVDYRAVMAAAAAYVAESRPRVSDPASVAALLRPLASGLLQEHFWCVSMDAKHGVLGVDLVTMGLANRSQVHAREVFRPAVLHGACHVLLAHNHPSGDPAPSSHDITCTRGLVEAGKIIGIPVLDHIVLGARTSERSVDWVSFRKEGLL